MSTSAEQDLRYPIGRMPKQAVLSPAERAAAIADIAGTAALLRGAVTGLDDSQLDTPYRPDGWTVRQVVHHVADSHMNAYARFRLAATEQNPTIKPYDESEWAKLEDARTMPVSISLDLLESMHTRLDVFLRTLDGDDFQRTVQHPENGPMTVDMLLAAYQWHGKHHATHITALRNRMQWS